MKKCPHKKSFKTREFLFLKNIDRKLIKYINAEECVENWEPPKITGDANILDAITQQTTHRYITQRQEIYFNIVWGYRKLEIIALTNAM